MTAEERIKACLKINPRQIYLDRIDESCNVDVFFLFLFFLCGKVFVPGAPLFPVPLLICFDAQAVVAAVAAAEVWWGRRGEGVRAVGGLNVPQESKSGGEMPLLKGPKVRQFCQRKCVQRFVLTRTVTNHLVIKKKNNKNTATFPSVASTPIAVNLQPRSA